MAVSSSPPHRRRHSPRPNHRYIRSDSDSPPHRRRHSPRPNHRYIRSDSDSPPSGSRSLSPPRSHEKNLDQSLENRGRYVSPADDRPSQRSVDRTYRDDGGANDPKKRLHEKNYRQSPDNYMSLAEYRPRLYNKRSGGWTYPDVGGVNDPEKRATEAKYFWWKRREMKRAADDGTTASVEASKGKADPAKELRYKAHLENYEKISKTIYSSSRSSNFEYHMLQEALKETPGYRTPSPVSSDTEFWFPQTHREILYKDPGTFVVGIRPWLSDGKQRRMAVAAFSRNFHYEIHE